MQRRDIVLQYFNEQKEENERITKEGIEKYRKSNCTIKVPKDKDITLEIKQKTHDFKFGANIFMLDMFDEKWQNDLYKENFAKLFNIATLPFYWKDVEPKEGKYRFDRDSYKIFRRPNIDTCLDYCKEHNIEPKCHCLNYDAFTPDWTKDLEIDEYKKKLEKRFSVIADRYKDIIPSYEVTNETLMMRHISKFFMEDDFLEWSYLTADKYFKDNELIINDFNIWDPTSNNRNYYYMQIERLLRTVTHLDTIGMQFHCFFPEEAEKEHAKQKFNPKRLRELFDLFAKFNKKMQITEMTIPARGYDDENEAIQSDLTVNLYKVLFSYPNMNAIIYWNLVDGYAYMPDGGKPGDMTRGENIYYGGFMRFDMTEKPVYKALNNLINKEWRTNLTLKPTNGIVEFPAFHGEYDIIIHSDNKQSKASIHISKDGDNTFDLKV